MKQIIFFIGFILYCVTIEAQEFKRVETTKQYAGKNTYFYDKFSDGSTLISDEVFPFKENIDPWKWHYRITGYSTTGGWAIMDKYLRPYIGNQIDGDESIIIGFWYDTTGKLRYFDLHVPAGVNIPVAVFNALAEDLKANQYLTLSAAGTAAQRSGVYYIDLWYPIDISVIRDYKPSTSSGSSNSSGGNSSIYTPQDPSKLSTPTR
ncbi:MAG: hypothetical protein LBM62_00675 [Mediterranea sp.]|jgi:hypothetical protein|nr:hypothetical protein [Mediterranea sp.]